METIALNQSIFTVSIPSMDTKKFKQFIKLMGWKAKEVPARARLYDPECGKYLNDKTMRAIEDANAGKDIAFRGTIDEFKAWADAL
ncbi:MAG: hypothetical protein MJZ88_04415 [Paludibacteraceae bacterium]|nr:hypothetical protein [Paludibacteraceae bacterium]